MIGQLFSWLSGFPPLVYIVLVLASVWYLKSKLSYPDNLPPIPVRPYPILGHIPHMGSDPVKRFHEWRMKAGDIFSIYLGPQLVIVMNSMPILKEALVKQADLFSDRNRTFISSNVEHGNLGIIGNSGPNWKEQRAVSMSILRRFGMGKNFLAEKITEEIEIYLQALAELKCEPSDIRLLTNSAVSNVICAILIGKRFELDDPYFVKLIKLLNEQVMLLGGTSILTIFPWLQYIPGDPFMGSKVQQNAYEIRGHFAMKFIQETKYTDEKERMNNFINAYYTELGLKEKANIPTHLDDRNLSNVMSNLFVAGTETTSTTLMWAVLFAIHYPEAQERVYQEILQVVGTQRLPSVQDRSKMYYTNAYIMETQRRGSIVPFSLSHMCTQTTTVAGYTIPKGATIIPCLEEVLKDKDTWGDPLEFRPERFLDADNNVTVPEEFIPFSLGRRYCMGESLAKMELFLFMCAIFQRFHILPEDPSNLPPLDPVFGVTCPPKPFGPKLVPRT